jgi:hypothetical protein
VKKKIRSRPNYRDLSFCFFALLTFFLFIASAQGSVISLDDFEEVAAINGGWGMFFVRFPTSDPPNSMQVLFGFIDDGRLVRFSGKPAVDKIVSVGNFQAGTRYSVWLIYDLVSFRYSVSLNSVTVVDQEPIPSYLAVDGIDKFGFDLNQKITLPDIPPAQGNTYYVDNIRFATLESIYLPIVLVDFQCPPSSQPF